MTSGQENALQAAQNYVDMSGVLEGGPHPATVVFGRRRLLEG